MRARAVVRACVCVCVCVCFSHFSGQTGEHLVRDNLLVGRCGERVRTAPRSVLRQGPPEPRKGKTRKHRFVSTLKLHSSSQSSGMLALRELVALPICSFAERLSPGTDPGRKLAALHSPRR
jgi:hypothetical protein